MLICKNKRTKTGENGEVMVDGHRGDKASDTRSDSDHRNLVVDRRNKGEGNPNVGAESGSMDDISDDEDDDGDEDDPQCPAIRIEPHELCRLRSKWSLALIIKLMCSV